MEQITGLKTSDYYFDLPQELIAQDPLKDRASSRLLVMDKSTGEVQHRIFSDIKEYPAERIVILPGVDDGADDMTETMRLLSAAREEGIRDL